MTEILFETNVALGEDSPGFHTHTEITWNVFENPYKHKLCMIVRIHDAENTYFKYNSDGDSDRVSWNFCLSPTVRTDLDGVYAWLETLPMQSRYVPSRDTLIELLDNVSHDNALIHDPNQWSLTPHNHDESDPHEISIDALMQSTRDALERFFDDSAYLLK